MNPQRVFILSFALLILSGTIIFQFDFANKGEIRFIDRLFTAASATCVTGLTVLDIYQRLSIFGQLYLLFLIQMGGLSLMSFASVFILLIGRKISFKDKLTLKEVLNKYDMKNLYSLLIYIILFTVTMEVIGAFILYGRWSFISDPITRFYFAIFHTISAYCNAGFSLFHDNLLRFNNDYITVLIITSLIIIGGLGFFVNYEIKSFIVNRIKNFFIIRSGGKKITPFKFSLHSKMVFTTTMVLILTGVIFLGIFEYHNVLKGKSFGNKFLISYFQSITPRTAGFNTVDIGLLTNSSLILLILLMFIGGSPGSTAGGIKTTSIASIFFMVKSILVGKDKVTAFFKTIDYETIKKVFTIFVLALALVILGTVLILLKEGVKFTPLQVLFEVVSAFGTVGLSTDITPHLSDFSKFILVLVMFAGRVGPLTLAISVFKKEKIEINFPEEIIGVG